MAQEKKIIVPTDFSENAFVALQHAVKIANQLSATLYLIHTIEISASAGHLMALDDVIAKERRKEMDELIAKIQPDLNENIEIKSHIRKGRASDATCSLAEKEEASYIIMGTLGASGLKKIFMGSTAMNVIRKTEIPVLAIPTNADPNSIPNITIALDTEKLESPFVLHAAISLARGLDANVNLLHVTEERNQTEDESIDESIQKYLDQFGVKYEYFNVIAPNTAQGILDFVEQEKQGVLCLVMRQRSWLEQWFHKSTTEEIAFEARVPLLALHTD